MSCLLRCAPQPGTARAGPKRRREHDRPTSTPGVTQCFAWQQKRTRLLRTPALTLTVLYPFLTPGEHFFENRNFRTETSLYYR